VVKPIRSEELVSRLRVAIRRSKGSATNLLRYGRLELDIDARCAWLDGLSLALSKNGFRLLRVLLLDSGKVISAETICQKLSSVGHPLSRNAIEELMTRLRKKIGPSTIKTVRGMGYRLDFEEVGELASIALAPCKAQG